MYTTKFSNAEVAVRQAQIMGLYPETVYDLGSTRSLGSSLTPRERKTVSAALAGVGGRLIVVRRDASGRAAEVKLVGGRRR